LLLIENIFAGFSGKYRFSAYGFIQKNVKFCQLCLIDMTRCRNGISSSYALR